MVIESILPDGANTKNGHGSIGLGSVGHALVDLNAMTMCPGGSLDLNLTPNPDPRPRPRPSPNPDPRPSPSPSP